jgi:hypothetical protein
MNHSTRVKRRLRRAWPPTARTAAAIIATAALALLAVACSGSPPSAGPGGSPNAGGSATSTSAVAYSHCMRSHGVPNFPDPTSSGQVPKASAQQFGVSSSQLQATQRACQHLLPVTGGSFQQQAQQCVTTGDCPRALVQQMLSAGLRFARCMRSHGVPNWPDPTIDSQGRPFFNLSGHGFTHSEWHSPQITSMTQECVRLRGAAPLPTG